MAKETEGDKTGGRCVKERKGRKKEGDQYSFGSSRIRLCVIVLKTMMARKGGIKRLRDSRSIVRSLETLKLLADETSTLLCELFHLLGLSLVDGSDDKVARDPNLLGRNATIGHAKTNAVQECIRLGDHPLDPLDLLFELDIDTLLDA